jgi:hypothetical protein
VVSQAVHVISEEIGRKQELTEEYGDDCDGHESQSNTNDQPGLGLGITVARAGLGDLVLSRRDGEVHGSLVISEQIQSIVKLGFGPRAG